jgi:exodeoxyribonuclease VII large subunit
MLAQAQWIATVQQDVVDAVRNRMAGEKHRLQSLVQRLPVATALFMQGMHHKLDLWQKYMDASSPERILSLGYSITRVNGRAVRSIVDVIPGDDITTTVVGGEFTSKIIDKNSK